MRKLAFAFLMLIGCSSEHGMLIEPGPPPRNGLQVVLPVMKDLQPGSDNELCTWTDVIADRDLFVRSIQGFQSAGGHHMVLYKSKVFEQPGTTRVCSNDDLTSLRFVSGAGGEGENVPAPGDLAFTIEQGYQIVINHHYLNAKPTTVDAQSAMNVYFAEADKSFTKTGAMAIVDTSFSLPPGSQSVDINCTLQKQIKVWHAIPHMHAYGVDISIDHVPFGGEQSRLFDTAWVPEYTFHPPAKDVEPSAPILFNPGDQVKVHCNWNNTTGKNMTFGIEMCVFFAQTVDDNGQGNVACDAGRWTQF